MWGGYGKAALRAVFYSQFEKGDTTQSDVKTFRLNPIEMAYQDAVFKNGKAELGTGKVFVWD